MLTPSSADVFVADEKSVVTSLPLLPCCLEARAAGEDADRQAAVVTGILG